MKKIRSLILSAVLMFAFVTGLAGTTAAADVSRVAKIGTTASIASGYYQIKPKCASRRC